MDLNKINGVKPTSNSSQIIGDDEKPDKNISTMSSGSPTPALDNFSTDLTKLVKSGTVCPVIGRDKELKRLTQILSRKTKRNAILVGESGTGKSAIVEGLAMLINKPDAPRTLIGKRILSLDLTSIVSGTKYRGQFEERMKVIIEELKSNQDIILFIDEIHTMVGAGNSAGSLDASNILKPALARGEIQIIGATTLDEYREKIEKDSALTRRFKEIIVVEPSISETKEILRNIKKFYEDYHMVSYSDEIIDECVKLTDRYISDRFMPDKAIDVLDEVGAVASINVKLPTEITDMENRLSQLTIDKLQVVKEQRFEDAAEIRIKEKRIIGELEVLKANWKGNNLENRTIITIDMLTDVISTMTGIPVTKISLTETKKLANMNLDLNSKIIGQEEAINTICKSIKRNKIGIKDIKKPISVFMLLGVSGCGKTLTAKLLAEHLFGDADSLIRIDMSEYMEKFAVSRLIGPPPGYVGYEEGGQLTEKIRRKPYSVILFDEIEKAHDDVFNLLLQVFDEGHLTDGLGRKVNFKNTLILMTSNLGIKEVSETSKSLGFTMKEDTVDAEDIKTKDIINKTLKKRFKPEFLNRLDDTIIYNSLNKDDIKRIVNLEIIKLEKRLIEIGYKLNVSDEVCDYIIEVGYDHQYGARPINRAIQKYIEDEICEAVINETIIPGQIIEVLIDENKKIIIK